MFADSVASNLHGRWDMNSSHLDEQKPKTRHAAVVERRHAKRFRLRDNGIALLTPPGPYSTIVGHILDISTGGLSFRYVSDVALGDKASEVTLTSTENKTYLRRLPVRTVSDFEIAKVPFGIMSPRRYGLKFGQLTEEQASGLRRFIGQHADDKTMSVGL
jgi:hypothetical protein